MGQGTSSSQNLVLPHQLFILMLSMANTVSFVLSLENTMSTVTNFVSITFFRNMGVDFGIGWHNFYRNYKELESPRLVHKMIKSEAHIVC